MINIAMSSAFSSELASLPESDWTGESERNGESDEDVGGIIRSDWPDGSAFVFPLLKFVLPSPIA
jgi:hypothetical protein